jgi:hypothetical protein
MATQPLALEWLVFIRDHGTDLKVTLGERALASLLPTYGQGKNIFVTMSGLARVTGWSRMTVIKHRNGLIAKGLLEDITGDPDRQTRVYRLTVPDYLPQGVQDMDKGVQNLDTTCTESEHNIKLRIKPEDQASKGKSTKAKTEKKRTAITQEHLGLSLATSSATSPRAVESSSAPEVDRTYVYWEKNGSWVVFPVSKAKYQPKSAQSVTLSDAENDFYKAEYTGGQKDNYGRVSFLQCSPEERAAGMDMCRAA